MEILEILNYYRLSEIFIPLTLKFKIIEISIQALEGFYYFKIEFIELWIKILNYCSDGINLVKQNYQ